MAVMYVSSGSTPTHKLDSLELALQAQEAEWWQALLQKLAGLSCIGMGTAAWSMKQLLSQLASSTSSAQMYALPWGDHVIAVQPRHQGRQAIQASSLNARNGVRSC